MKKGILWILIFCLVLSGCGAGNGQQEDLMQGIRANAVSVQTSPEGTVAIADFGLALLRQASLDQQNILVSPLSIVSALAMTANGADGETLSQMQQVLGLDVEELNRYLSAYLASLPSDADYKLSMANAIWFEDDPKFQVYPEFLQTNADYYQAGIYKTPFDEGTKNEINAYVKENTDGMIQEILDRIPEEAVMYLVNALAFDAKWQSVYDEFQVREGIFTNALGQEQQVEMMRSEESEYLEDESAVGVIKNFADGKYAFAALVPKEGIDLDTYLQTLNGEKLIQILTNPQNITTYTSIPRFEADYSAELSQVLSELGMPDAFDERANFTKMGEYDGKYLCIGRVLHKTAIRIDAQGARAGAATVVEMVAEGCVEAPEDTRTVELNKPFVYMLIDRENHLPFFIGTMTDMG